MTFSARFGILITRLTEHTMKAKKLLALLGAAIILAGTSFTTGCSTGNSGTTPAPKAAKYAPLVQMAVYTGATVHLRDNEGDLPIFEQVKESLDALLFADKLDIYAVNRVLATLPVKELKGDNVQLIVTATTALIVAYQDDILPPDTKSTLEFAASEARVVISAIRDALADAIMQAKLSSS